MVKTEKVKQMVDYQQDSIVSRVIKEEIAEKIEPLWDVEKVLVEFTE